MAGKVHNSLLEMLVAVGLDEDTGLVCSDDIEDEDLSDRIKLFRSTYKAEVLAAISANVALFPSSSVRPDANYPPSHGKPTPQANATRTWPRRTGAETTKSPSVAAQALKHELTSLPTNGSTDEASTSTRRSVKIIRRTTFKPVDFASRCKSTDLVALKPAEFPLNAETLNSLASLCYPDDVHIHETRPRDVMHYLCLTDLKGNRTYGTCYTYYQRHVACKNYKGNWMVEHCPEKSQDFNESEGIACFLPICFVAISKYPYLTLLKDLLSSLVLRLETNSELWSHVLKEFSLHLCMVPVPPAGNLNLEFSMNNVKFIVPSSDCAGRAICDWDLSIIPQCFDAEVASAVVTCLLTQQRMVFFSTNFALLPMVTESFLQLIQPFVWCFTYVPLTPESLLELMDAPGTFIMGCHSKHNHYLKEIDDPPVSIDIDTGSIHFGNDPLPKLPQAPLAIFKEAYKQLAVHLRTGTLDWAGTFSYESRKEQELERRRTINAAIRITFLEFIVNLFRDVLIYIKPERRFFHKEQFMATLEEDDHPFYEQVMGTEMFNAFLKARLSQERDYWTDLVDRTVPQHRNFLDSQAAHPSPMRKSQSFSALSCLSIQPNSKLNQSISLFPLPNFVYGLSPKYLDNCVNEISSALRQLRGPGTGIRGPLVYQRGMLRAALGLKVDALADFHNLAACDIRLLPKDYIKELISSLSDDERQRLEGNVFYPSSPLESGSADTLQRQRDQSIVMELNKLPQNDIDKENFSSLLLMLDIASDHDAIGRLFDALSPDGCPVDASSFEELYKCWKENEVEIQQAPSTYMSHLDSNEGLLVLSNMIKTSFGMGRIGLTHKRLFFLHEGSHKYKEVVRLRDLENLELCHQRSFLSLLPALKLHTKDEKTKVFVASLKQNCNLWHLMTSEMWAGKILAEELRDPSIVQLAAHNVLLLHSFIRRRADGSGSLPPETKDVLQHRLDPSVGQPTHFTVEALLYTPGKRSGDGKADEDMGPQLWCGLASGRIYVYDASSWMLHQPPIQASSRVVCLCAVGDTQVWAGSFDCIIYIIDTRTRCYHQTLRKHTDLVTDIAISPDGSVYSCSINGEILQWDPNTLEQTTCKRLEGQVSLKTMQFVNDHLWCGTRTEILQVSPSDGVILRKLAVSSELWLGLGKIGQIVVYQPETWEVKKTLYVSSRGVSKIMHIRDKMWVGSKDGKLHIFDSVTYKQEKELQAHEDSVRSMCCAHQRYVITGAGSHDGRVAIWRASTAALPL
ncbi:hypothetical protein CAPTEDRAFT_218926 [Capitella teleta]|uniref:UDENN domain-containing protein n=1 Tax=Capitella teleta TaxID=283909 RepID=R7VA69_CAPTE|nr:hypothetical protein CAPTEDRAFT_218926 [Capitella teleta]|eukprot:ELU12620.1 hypothetical protein CAPTEDRAFT_218926 [Capitella teleta]